MPITTLEATVVCVHGEGDRATVNRRADRYNQALWRPGQPPPAPADEPPQVSLVLRDEYGRHHPFRLEVPLDTWDEVEAAKAAIGWDAAKRHWKHGAKVRITIGE